MSVRFNATTEEVRQRPTGDREGSRASISKNDAFHLLQNTRRRAVLRHLLEQDEKRLWMRDITEAVAAWEYDTTVARLDSDERQRVYIALYQNHLPKLDDEGVIDYDQSQGIVEPAPLIRVFEPFLDDGLDSDCMLTAPTTDATDATDSASAKSHLTRTVSSLFDR